MPPVRKLIARPPSETLPMPFGNAIGITTLTQVDPRTVIENDLDRCLLMDGVEALPPRLEIHNRRKHKCGQWLSMSVAVIIASDVFFAFQCFRVLVAADTKLR